MQELEALKVMVWTKVKTAIVVGTVVLFAAGATFVTAKGGSARKTGATAQSDVAALQGTWSGQETGVGGADSVSIVIRGTNLEFRGASPQEWYKGTFSLREDTSPKQLVGVVTECPAPQYVGKTSYAIYQLQDGKFTLVGNEPGNPRGPESFDAQEGRKFVFTKKK